MAPPRIPLFSRRIRWYAVHTTCARLMLLWVVVIVVITPRVPVPQTREPHRAVLRVSGGFAVAGALVGTALALRDRRRSVRRQYALSTAACLAALVVGVLGYPPHSGGPAPPPAEHHVSRPSA